ncbi:MAG TPA: NHLP-related RiPP peptide [Lysobacter sp.]|nr:NHLP-related RiPP peptide [Lysobacter sp.]
MAGQGKDQKRPLEQKVVKKLLHKLSTDDNFRALFQRNPHAALVEAGWEAAPDETGTDAEMAEISGGSCLTMTNGATLASKEQIAARSATLEQELSVPFGFFCPPALLAD